MRRLGQGSWFSTEATKYDMHDRIELAPNATVQAARDGYLVVAREPEPKASQLT